MNPRSVLAYVLLAIVGGSSLSAQGAITPGDQRLNPSLLHPFRREYVTYSYECEPPGPDSTRDGTYSDQLIVSGDSAWLQVTVHHGHTGNPVVDSTWVDRRTLAPLLRRQHAGVYHDTWVYRGSRVSFWSTEMHVPASQSVDATVDPPPFDPGELELLVLATPSLMQSGQQAVYHTVTLHQDTGEPPDGLVATDMEAALLDSLAPSPLSTISHKVWLLSVDYDTKYWLDPRTAIPLAYGIAQNESICPQKWFLIQP